MTGEAVRNAKPRTPPQAYKWESYLLQLWPGAQEPVFILLVILMQLKCENHLPSYRVETGCPSMLTVHVEPPSLFPDSQDTCGALSPERPK